MRMTDEKLMAKVVGQVKQLPYGRLVELSTILEGWLSKDNRAHPRKAVSIPVEIVSDDQLVKEVTKNVSSGGTLMTAKDRNRFRLDQQISMVFYLDKATKTCQVTGKIARIREDGIAVEFDQVSNIFNECTGEELYVRQ